MRNMNFQQILTRRTKLCGRLAKQSPIYTDDEVILAELFAFSATLTPLI